MNNWTRLEAERQCAAQEQYDSGVADESDTTLDPTWLQETINDLREQGCDEQFIQCCIDDLKEGGTVTVITSRYTCNGSPKGCEGERFGGCTYCEAMKGIDDL